MPDCPPSPLRPQFSTASILEQLKFVADEPKVRSALSRSDRRFHGLWTLVGNEGRFETTGTQEDGFGVPLQVDCGAAQGCDGSEAPSILDDLRLYSYLAKKVHLSIIVTNEQVRVIWCNKAFTDQSGYSLGEMIGRSPGFLLQGPLTDPVTVRYMRQRIRQRKAFQAELINYRRDGSPYWVRIEGHPLADRDHNVSRYVAFQTDVTKSKKAQSAVLHNETTFRSIFDHSLDALLLVSPENGSILDANRAAIELFATRKLVGRKLEEIFPQTDAFKVDQLTQLVNESNGVRRETGEFITPEGEPRPVEMTINRTPIGDSVSLFVTLRDVSAKRLLEEQLRRAQRMEAVGRLAGGIAHDFNNLLTGLRGFSELLCNSRDLCERDHVYSQEVLKITDRASKLTGRLLSFSRGKSEQPVVTNLNEIVSNIIPMLSRILRKDVQFTSKLDPGLSNVRVDPAQVEQVIVNLVMNGQEAITGCDGVVMLDTRMMQLTGSEIFVTGKPRPGMCAAICVRDSGHGIAPEMLEKVFEPFFITKKGAGTGLGLPIVYGIIQKNGGHLKVDSDVGRGTEFSVYFPTVTAAVERPEPMNSDTDMPIASSREGPAPTILIAEDQDQVREILELGLGQSGYELLIATDGKEAIELARKHPGRIDLLLTDSIMPKVQGCDVAKEVRALYPDISILMMSGLPQQESEDSCDVQIDGYVDKPFSIRKLLERIESLLAVKGGPRPR